MPLVNTDLRPNPLSPIERSTGTLRIYLEQDEQNIYTKYSPYAEESTSILSSIGPKQPFVYVGLRDSSIRRNFTKYDSQALPVGSTARDLERIGKFLITGNGILFNATQLVLQNANAFNETRIYNPASVLGAVAKTGTFGITNRPVRFIRSNGGIGNFFASALQSTVGLQTVDFTTQHIEGTAGSQTNSPLPAYEGSGRAGLLRLQTAQTATARFDRIWAGAATGTSISERLRTAFTNTLRSLVPSTNPLGIGGSGGNTWQYRPEYRDTKTGIYYDFLNNRNLLGYTITPTATIRPEFYNGTRSISTRTRFEPKVHFHKYYPEETTTVPRTDNALKWYASKGKTETELIDNTRGIVEKFKRMVSTFNLETTVGFNGNNASTERFISNIDAGVPRGKNYQAIPATATAGRYYNYFKSKKITIEDKGFAKVSTPANPNPSDTYNALSTLRSSTPLFSPTNPKQSQDIIFFYFFDVVNKVYVPFRAVITSLYDQNTPDWEAIKYMGRADSLFIYKGFSRDITIGFTVYANSIDELIPMWERINYLVGFTRPSRYTGRATSTTSTETTVNGDLEETVTTGLESGFIYPPMLNFRLGDLYVDQPAVMNSVNVTIPDKSEWETLRDNDYSYIFGRGIDAFGREADISLKRDGRKSRQLPLMADITVQLRIIEKQKSLTKNFHYGPLKGWKNVL